MLGDGSHFAKFLCQLRSLTTFDVTLNLCGNGDKGISHSLLKEAMKSRSLETLRFKVNDPHITSGSRGYDFSEYAVMSPSLSRIELAVSFYGVEESSREWNLEREKGCMGKLQVICFKSGKTTALIGSLDISDAKAVSDALWMKQLCHLHSLGIVFGCHWRRLSKTTEPHRDERLLKILKARKAKNKL